MDKKTVTTISYLSRLKIDDEKEQKVINDLSNIIEFVDDFIKVNVEGVSIANLKILRSK